MSPLIFLPDDQIASLLSLFLSYGNRNKSHGTRSDPGIRDRLFFSSFFNSCIVTQSFLALVSKLGTNFAAMCLIPRF